MVLDADELRILRRLLESEVARLEDRARYFDACGRSDRRHDVLCAVARVNCLLGLFQGTASRVVFTHRDQPGRPVGGSRIHETLLVS